MVTFGVDDGSLQADSQPMSAGLVFSLHSSNEPSELLQSFHDDSTVNIGIVIVILEPKFFPVASVLPTVSLLQLHPVLK